MGRVIREAAGWGREVKPRRACEAMVKTGLTLILSGMYSSGRVLRSDKIRLLFSLDHSSGGVQARPVKCVSLQLPPFFPKRGLYIPTLLPLDMQCREEYSPHPHISPYYLSTQWSVWGHVPGFGSMECVQTRPITILKSDCMVQLSPLVLLSAIRIADGRSLFRMDPGMKRHVKKSHSL